MDVGGDVVRFKDLDRQRPAVGRAELILNDVVEYVIDGLPRRQVLDGRQRVVERVGVIARGVDAECPEQTWYSPPVECAAPVDLKDRNHVSPSRDIRIGIIGQDVSVGDKLNVLAHGIQIGHGNRIGIVDSRFALS